MNEIDKIQKPYTFFNQNIQFFYYTIFTDKRGNYYVKIKDIYFILS